MRRATAHVVVLCLALFVSGASWVHSCGTAHASEQGTSITTGASCIACQLSAAERCASSDAPSTSFTGRPLLEPYCLVAAPPSTDPGFPVTLRAPPALAS